MWNFQDTSEARKQSIISAFSIYMTVSLSGLQINIGFFLKLVESKGQRYINIWVIPHIAQYLRRKELLFLIKKRHLQYLIFRSSRSQMFFKIGVLKNFANFTAKHLCWSTFFIKLQAWRAATLLKRDSNTGVIL